MRSPTVSAALLQREHVPPSAVREAMDTGQPPPGPRAPPRAVWFHRCRRQTTGLGTALALAVVVFGVLVVGLPFVWLLQAQ